MRKLTFLLTLYAICCSLHAQENDTLDVTPDVTPDTTSGSNANTEFDKVEADRTQNMVKVATLGTIAQNQQFQNNVKAVKAAYNVVEQLRAAMSMELDPEKLAEIEKKFNEKPMIVDGILQMEHTEGPRFMTRLIEAFPQKIESITYRKPTLEDVFLHHTGHQFWEEEA